MGESHIVVKPRGYQNKTSDPQNTRRKRGGIKRERKRGERRQMERGYPQREGECNER